MTTFVTVGSNRVYVQVEGDFTYDNWMRALRNGRTFVTNSPLLDFKVNGRPPGDVIDVSSGKGVVRVEASVQSQLPYDRLEIVVNGAPVADSSPSGVRHRAAIKLEYLVSDSCWIAARVLEDLATYRSKQVNLRAIHQARGTLHGDYYGTRRPETVFAHTSPVYLLREGRPIRSEEDAEYYVRYLESASRGSRRRASLRGHLIKRPHWRPSARGSDSTSVGRPRLRNEGCAGAALSGSRNAHRLPTSRTSLATIHFSTGPTGFD